MSELVLRNLPQDIISRLLSLAGAHGITPEEEGERLLRKAIESDDGERHSLISHLLSDEGRVDDLELPPKWYPSKSKSDFS